MLTVYQRTPTAEEQQALVVGQDVFQMTESAGWTRLCEYMQLLVDEVQAEAFANLSSDPLTHMRHVIRYQQRESVRLALLGYVHEHLEERKRLIELLQEPEEAEEWQHQL